MVSFTGTELAVIAVVVVVVVLLLYFGKQQAALKLAEKLADPATTDTADEDQTSPEPPLTTPPQDTGDDQPITDIPRPIQPPVITMIPTIANIVSGENVTFEIRCGPTEGPDVVTELVFDFGDGTSERYEPWFPITTITHRYTYHMPKGSKYTGKTYFPHIVAIGARAATKEITHGYSVTVAAKE